VNPLQSSLLVELHQVAPDGLRGYFQPLGELLGAQRACLIERLQNPQAPLLYKHWPPP
jgi:hypothetical protein